MSKFKTGDLVLHRTDRPKINAKIMVVLGKSNELMMDVRCRFWNEGTDAYDIYHFQDSELEMFEEKE